VQGKEEEEEGRDVGKGRVKVGLGDCYVRGMVMYLIEYMCISFEGAKGWEECISLHIHA
jgi:hypothetical protein